MKIKAPKKWKPKKLHFSFSKNISAEIVVVKNPQSKTVFFTGKVDGCPVTGFINRAGGYVADSDALNRKLAAQFIDVVRAKK